MPARPSSSWNSAMADGRGRFTGRRKQLGMCLGEVWHSIPEPQVLAFWEKPERTVGTSARAGTQQAVKETLQSLQSLMSYG